MKVMVWLDKAPPSQVALAMVGFFFFVLSLAFYVNDLHNQIDSRERYEEGQRWIREQEQAQEVARKGAEASHLKDQVSIAKTEAMNLMKENEKWTKILDEEFVEKEVGKKEIVQMEDQLRYLQLERLKAEKQYQKLRSSADSLLAR